MNTSKKKRHWKLKGSAEMIFETVNLAQSNSVSIYAKWRVDWGGRSETQLLCYWMRKQFFCLFPLLPTLCASSFPFHQYKQAKVPGARLQGEVYGTVPLRHQLCWTLFRSILLAGVHGWGEWLLNKLIAQLIPVAPSAQKGAQGVSWYTRCKLLSLLELLPSPYLRASPYWTKSCRQPL